MKKNIVLIGYRGSGKTTVGKILSSKLSYTFIDTDDEIVKKTGMNIPEIVEKLGWEKFRDLESEVASEKSKLSNCVISTGGGIIIRKKNIDFLKSNGWITFLKVSPENIYERIKDSVNRPSLTKNKSFLDEITEVLNERTNLYLRYSDFKVDTNTLVPDYISEVIIDEYRRI